MFAARIAVSDMASANATLEAAGWGPRNFSEAVYTGPAPTHAALHAWGPLAFITAVKALPGVTWSEAEGTPDVRVSAAVAGVSGKWSNEAPQLAGVVTPGLYRLETDFWWVIQQYDTALWPDPTAVPALVRRARVPGTVQPWVQPLDQFDAYKLSNPFTGQPDRATHNGKEWEVTQADGAGNNVNEPGVFGWRDVNAPAVPAWAPWPGFGPLYQIGDRVTHNGQTWQSTAANNVWEPGVFGWVVV